MRDASSGRSMTRRTLLQLGVAAGLTSLAGCRPDAGAGAASAMQTPASSDAGSPRPVDAATALARRVADAERSLIAAYDSAVAGDGGLAALLGPLRADHAAHLAGLVPGASPSSGPSPSAPPASASDAGSPPDSPPASAATSPATSPATRAHVATRLADLERAAAADRIDDLMTTPDGAGSLARLLASIGGCEASHVELLQAAATKAPA